MTNNFGTFMFPMKTVVLEITVFKDQAVISNDRNIRISTVCP